MALKPEGEEVRAETETGSPAQRDGRALAPLADAEDDQGVNLNPSTLEEALETIRLLRSKQHAEGEAAVKPTGAAHQLLYWRRRALAFEEAAGRLSRASQDQLQMLSGQLMLLKARLVRKQKDIGRMLAQREAVIQRQQRTIHLLQTRLQEAGVDMTHGELDSPTGETNLDSLNDSDSAVIMEDGPGSDHEHSVFIRLSCGGVPVARSVSDAAESPSAKWRQQQYQTQQRNNGFNFLRRPEILETVYSVEEDGEGDGTATTATPAADGAKPTVDDTTHSRRTSSHSYKGDSNSSVDETPSVDDSSCSTAMVCGPQYGSLEVLTDLSLSPRVSVSASPHHVTTYNRVMSNHRSVTKPKDVKYKRINKAKSKSLEELRGRLRNWVEKGISSNKFISLDQSYA